MAKGTPSGMTGVVAAQQQNIQARNFVIASAIDETQQIFQNTYTTGPGTVINIPLRNVGLVKRLWVKFAATISSAAHTQNITTLGTANFFSNVTLTDLSNQTRINTPGWHLFMVTSAKARAPYGQAILAASTDSPVAYGNNFTQVQSAPATISASMTSNNVFGFLEIPISYSDYDLRGAIYANVLNATFNLQLTVNPNMFALSTATDATFAVYKSADTTAATMSSFTITVYQNYLDQLPVANGQVVLPYGDLGVAYLFNQTNFAGLVQNSDNPFFYANFRDFMSTCIIYDNAGTLNQGSDIAYFALQTANYTNILKVDPTVFALWTRLRLRQDMPIGTYYFDHRKKPISTAQYGNQALVINPSTVTSSASALYLGYEMLANIAQITNAGSLPGT